MLKRSTLIAGLALACAAPAAGADSIVFVDGGNVAVSQPDGKGKVQLTDGGGWHSPTQADDGTIAAVNGAHEIVVMAKDGRVIRKIATPKDVPTGNGGVFSGVPQQLSFSPNGQRIAYAYLDTNCPPASSCGSVQRSVLYTHVDSDTATPVSVYGNQHSVSDPEWIDSDRALVFGGAFKHVNIDTLDAGDYNYVKWFSRDTPGEEVSDGELSRSGNRFASVFGYGDNVQLAFFSGGPGASPSLACKTTEPDPKFADPSWSPDSTSVAFASSAGVEVLKFTAISPGQCGATGPSVVVAPGASQPDWGPAEPAAARYVAPVVVEERKPDPVVVPDPVQPPVVRVVGSGARKQKFRGSLSVTCTASVAGACEAVATVKAGTKSFTSKVARKQVAADQATTLKLTFSKAAAAGIRKALKRGATTRATVKLTAAGATANHLVRLTK